LRGPTSKGTEGKGREKEGRGKRREGKGRGKGESSVIAFGDGRP